ncbi:MAG: class I SAM-dependent methyltransferase [Ramlibacter sp.]|nr:class I SAM-dependent methyltransferase [Ramlibacter sp.]
MATDAATQKLGVSRDSVMLDLCCGRGELASGFASFCRTIYAVDGSQKMLNNSIAQPNITYLLHDVNHDAVALPQPVDCVVIGSAIHWVEPPSMARLLEHNLKTDGKVLVTHTLLKLEEQPWYSALTELNASYGRRGIKGFKDLEGADRMHACGFGKVDGIRVVRPVHFDAEYLYLNQLSYLYDDFYERVLNDLPGYRQRLANVAAPYLDAEGKLSSTLVNWGVVYGALP